MGDAITSLESLADRGVVDAAASYDRGLAYAMRVRIGAEQSGDLGNAAQGFEEARDLTRDPKLAEDAGRALTVVRGEVARRRLRSHQPVEVEPGRSLARTLAGLLGEGAWTWAVMVCSAALGLGLFVRWLAATARPRAIAGVVAGVAAPVLVFTVAMVLAARHDRLTLAEAVVIDANTRPSDERGVSLPGATTLPEAGRVEIIDEHAAGSMTRVRFGTLDAWVPSSSLRPLARAD